MTTKKRLAKKANKSKSNKFIAKWLRQMDKEYIELVEYVNNNQIKLK